MGMRVGSGGGGAVLAQMQASQMAQKAIPTVESASTPKASPIAALNAQNNQMQSVLSLIRGQGSQVDMMA